jgi:acetyl esterase/lipase
MYRKAGHSVPELRKPDALLIRSQRLPKGTQVTSVALDGIPGEWVRGPGAGTDAATLYLHGGAFVVGEGSRDTPPLQPLEMDLTALPPMWIQGGDHEILLSDAERLARRASEAGVDVDLKIWPGPWHVFQSTARMVPEARESPEKLGRFIKRHLSPSDGPDATGARR